LAQVGLKFVFAENCPLVYSKAMVPVVENPKCQLPSEHMRSVNKASMSRGSSEASSGGTPKMVPARSQMTRRSSGALTAHDLMGQDLWLPVTRRGAPAPKMELVSVAGPAEDGRAVSLKLSGLPAFRLPVRSAAHLVRSESEEEPNSCGKPPEHGKAFNVMGAARAAANRISKKYHKAMCKLSRRHGWCHECLGDLMDLQDLVLGRKSVVLVPCSHIMHEDCLAKHSKTHGGHFCPECSRAIQATVSI